MILGRSVEESDLILGMCARLTIVVGGSCHATNVANSTLASGGFVIAIASTGGAAAGLHCKTCNLKECKIDLHMATQRAIEKTLFKDDGWSRLKDPETRPETSVRIICQFLSELP